MSLEKAKAVLRIEAEGILALIDQLGPDFLTAVDLIMACPGRVVITGIGKSGIIGQKIAATLNSTGTPSLFLHPVEAMHGDLGIVASHDVVIAISNSGETVELNILLPSFKKRGVKIIAMTGAVNSTLAQTSEAVISIAVPKEACPLGLAPTASTTATLAMGDALAVVLLDQKQFNASDFRRNHPGGSLGERLKIQVSDAMMLGEEMPTVLADSTLRKAIGVLNEKNLGAVLVMKSAQEIVGIVTDGDIRRLVSNGQNPDTTPLNEIMTTEPKTISQGLLVADAVSIMQRHEITILPVTDNEQRLIGILHLHDLLGKGEFRFLV